MKCYIFSETIWKIKFNVSAAARPVFRTNVFPGSQPASPLTRRRVAIFPGAPDRCVRHDDPVGGRLPPRGDPGSWANFGRRHWPTTWSVSQPRANLRAPAQCRDRPSDPAHRLFRGFSASARLSAARPTFHQSYWHTRAFPLPPPPPSSSSSSPSPSSLPGLRYGTYNIIIMWYLPSSFFQ